MKLRLLLIFPFLLNTCLVFRVFAQKALPGAFGNVIYFNSEVTDAMRVDGLQTQGALVPDDNLRSMVNKAWLQNNAMKMPIMLGVKLNPALTNYNLSPVKSFGKSYQAFKISDRSDATLIALGITKENINNFRYHVVLNDSAEVIHWSPIPGLEQGYGADTPYGFIGKFNYPGKQALVEVVNINDYQFREGVIFDWRKSFRPVIAGIRVSEHTFIHDTLRVVGRKAPSQYVKYDIITGAPSEIKLPFNSVSDIEVFLKDHESIPYYIAVYQIKNGKKSIFDAPAERGTPNDLTFDIRHYPAGNYEIVFQPVIPGGTIIQGQAVHLQLIILPPRFPVNTVSLTYVLICLAISLLFFVIYRRRSNARLFQSLQAKQIVSLKLKSIRSQLNPHFMFNALTSIQNLVNKNDIEGANHYLSRFANLTRKVLSTGEQDMISLEDELKILSDYLQIEQLRFNFQYEIHADAHINMANTDVPAMLLQPFVENATKHGVAKLREDGLIKIQINQIGHNLLLHVIDNGQGFKQEKKDGQNNQFGLKLSEERIQLLNEVYKSQPTILTIQSGETGTHITITLTNWIA